MSHLFAIQGNNRDESVDVSSVTFVTMAGAASDDNSSILANRPQADNVIVLTNKDNTDETYQVLFTKFL